MGSLSLHRSINSELPSKENLITEIFSGNQGEDWKYFEITVETDDLKVNDIFEVGQSYKRNNHLCDFRNDLASVRG